MKQEFMEVRKCDYLLNWKTKNTVFLQPNLIIYPKVEPMSDTGLEKFLEGFILEN